MLPRCASGKTAAGFGKSNKKIISTDGAYAGVKGKKRLDDEFAKNRGPSSSAPQQAEGAAPSYDLAEGTWAAVGDAAAMFAEKAIKPVILATGKSLCVYKVGDDVFCSDAASTAYQYPLVDGKVLAEASGPAIESPLDGSVYDLASGKVLRWCPSEGNLVRGLLGTLKKDVPAVDLKVYRAAVGPDGQLMIRLSTEQP